MRNAFHYLTAVAAVCFVPSLLAQGSAAPKPGAAHEKLSFYEGEWTSSGTVEASPMGPGGPITGTAMCEWFTGGFYLVCSSEGEGPSGPQESLWFLGYSSERKQYTYYGIDNSGMGAEPAYGRVSGNTWTWEWHSTMNGQPVKGRYVTTHKGPDAYDWYWEVSMGGSPMQRMGQGTDTRVQ